MVPTGITPASSVHRSSSALTGPFQLGKTRRTIWEMANASWDPGTAQWLPRGTQGAPECDRWLMFPGKRQFMVCACDGVPPLSSTLVGRRCVSIRVYRYRYGCEPLSLFGPLEFGWDRDGFTTLDANTDWTLDISPRQWSDPFAQMTNVQRARLATEVGIWEEGPLPEWLGQFVGLTVSETQPQLNHMGDLIGLRVAFGERGLIAKVFGGELYVEDHSRRSD